MNKTFIAVLMAAVIIISAAIMVAGADDEAALMYVNDSPWAYEAQYPQADIFHVIYVPISMFKSIEGVTVRENKFLRNVVITHGEKYVTFDLNNSIIYTSDGGQISASTYLLYESERYVPAQITCTQLGLKYEYTADSALRISDSTAKLTFNELLLLYNISIAETEPEIITESETEPPEPVTEPETEPATEPIETEPQPERTIFFTFVCGGGYEREIADMLDDNGIKAAFFCDKSYIEGNAADIRALDGAGNSVGLYISKYIDIESFKSELSAANKFLYSATKSKTHIFSCGFDLAADISADAKTITELEEFGYRIAAFNCDVYYQLPASKGFLTSSVKRYIDANIISVLRFNTNQFLYEALPNIIELLSQYSNMNIETLTDVSIPEV